MNISQLAPIFAIYVALAGFAVILFMFISKKIILLRPFRSLAILAIVIALALIPYGWNWINSSDMFNTALEFAGKTTPLMKFCTSAIGAVVGAVIGLALARKL